MLSNSVNLGHDTSLDNISSYRTDAFGVYGGLSKDLGGGLGLGGSLAYGWTRGSGYNLTTGLYGTYNSADASHKLGASMSFDVTGDMSGWNYQSIGGDYSYTASSMPHPDIYQSQTLGAGYSYNRNGMDVYSLNASHSFAMTSSAGFARYNMNISPTMTVDREHGYAMDSVYMNSSSSAAYYSYQENFFTNKDRAKANIQQAASMGVISPGEKAMLDQQLANSNYESIFSKAANWMGEKLGNLYNSVASLWREDNKKNISIDKIYDDILNNNKLSVEQKASMLRMLWENGYDISSLVNELGQQIRGKLEDNLVARGKSISFLDKNKLAYTQTAKIEEPTNIYFYDSNGKKIIDQGRTVVTDDGKTYALLGELKIKDDSKKGYHIEYKLQEYSQKWNSNENGWEVTSIGKTLYVPSWNIQEINNGSSTFCNLVFDKFAFDVGINPAVYGSFAQDGKTFTMQNANRLNMLLESGGLNNSNGSFVQVDWQTAEKWATLGGFSVASWKNPDATTWADSGNSHGHIGIVTGGYDGPASKGNINTYQGGAKFGYMTMGEGFGLAKSNDTLFYIWIPN